MRRQWVYRAGFAVALLITPTTASCVPQPRHSRSTETSVQTPARKTTKNPVRHELEPLTKRFPALGSPISASWVSGDMGDPEAPGPSMYWIDAIVELTPDAVTALKSKYQPVATTTRPDVWNTLVPMLPAGVYLISSALDEAFTSTKIRAKAYLAEQASVIVITSMGE